MFIRNSFSLLIIVVIVTFAFLFHKKPIYAETEEANRENNLEKDIFTDQTFVWTPLPAFNREEVDKRSVNFMVKLKLLKYSTSLSIKSFVFEKKDPLAESSESLLRAVVFYFPSSKEEREIKFVVSIPTDLPFEASHLRLEFYEDKGETPETVSAQMFPVVVL